MGYKFTNISEINISFISNLRDMTYEHYIQQPKPMVEWTLIKKTAKDPSLIKNFTNTYHPSFRKYINILLDDGGED